MNKKLATKTIIKRAESLDWHFFINDHHDSHLKSKEEIFSAISSLFSTKNNEEILYQYLIKTFTSLVDLLYSEEKDWEDYTLPYQNILVLIKVIKESALRYNRAYLLIDNPLTDEARMLDYLITQMARETVEQFRILFFDKKKKLILDEIQTRGTVNHTQVYPREIAKRCVELKASYVLLAHNHPSGDASPSPSDVMTTQQVQRALNIFNIEVVDHYIISKSQQISMKKMDLLLSLHQYAPSF